MELPGKVHQETSKTSEAENSLIKQSADGLDSSEGKGRSSAIKVSEDQDEYAAALEQENRKETAEPEKATFRDSLGESRDETDVRRQSTHDWWDLEVDWEDFEVDGEDPSGTASKASAKDTTEPSMTTHMASKNEGESEPAEQTPGPEQATGSESGLLPVEAQTLMQSEVEAFCAHLTRLWPEVSATDAFVHFAGRGSDTLFAGTFTSVANSVGLPVDIFPLLSGDKSYVHLEDWLGFLEGAVQMVPEAPAAPAHQREEEFEQRVRDLLESLEEEEDTSTESTGAANTDSAVQGSEDEPSSPEEVSVQDDHSLTQRNDLKALVQELQAQLNKSEEEKIRWQREAQRQEEAATELREEMMRLMQGRTTGTCSEDLRLGARRRQWPHQRGVGSGPTIKDYKVGEQVQAVFPGDGYWYSAVVTKIGGTFTVKWDDPYGGPEESEVDAKDMKYPRIPFDKLELGQKYHGTVKSVLDFGAIVDIGAQSHGLLHISCICKERIENIYDILSEGQQVDVWISGKREDEGKYGLTMVGLSDRRRRPPADLKPFADLPSDEWFNGVVARIVPFGAFVTVTLEDGPSADGLLHVSKIKDGFVDKVENYVSTGQDVQVRVESVDLDSNKMNLSMRGSRMIQDPRVQQWWYSFTRPIA